MMFKELAAKLKFEGYQGVITSVDTDTGIFKGEVLLTKDIVTFKSETIPGLIEAFRESVTDYLEFCREEGDLPAKPLKGELLVRCGEDIQSQIINHIQSLKLSGEKISQNEWCKSAFKEKLAKEAINS